MSQQLEKEAASVLSQMSQLVQPSTTKNGVLLCAENQPSPSSSSSVYGDSEHAYAHNTTISEQQAVHNLQSKEDSKQAKHHCETCGKGFRKLYNLKSHLRVHTGERPYPCVCCDKAFSNASDLVRHSRSHTGEKPYECDECGRCFAEFGSYRRHVRLHTSDNPFRCELCHREFSRSDTYKNHLRCHANDKPFKCAVCEKGFNYKSSYTRHLLSHGNAGKKHLTCAICSKQFARADYLKVHRRCHDKDLARKFEKKTRFVDSNLDDDVMDEVGSCDLGPVPILLSLATRGGSITSYQEMNRESGIERSPDADGKHDVKYANCSLPVACPPATVNLKLAVETIIDHMDNSKVNPSGDVLVTGDIEAALLDAAKESCEGEWRCDPLWMTLKDSIIPLPRFLVDTSQASTSADCGFMEQSQRSSPCSQGQLTCSTSCLSHPYNDSNGDQPMCHTSSSIFTCTTEAPGHLYDKPDAWHNSGDQQNFACSEQTSDQHGSVDVVTPCTRPEDMPLTNYQAVVLTNETADAVDSHIVCGDAIGCGDVKHLNNIFPSDMAVEISQEIIVEAYAAYSEDN